MSTFRFAVMGAGDISHKFCDAARRIPGCEICAVSSKSPERAKAFASREGIPSAYGSYAEMLEKENPDCVYIGADTGSHYSLTMLCLGHKTPVLCEKAQFCSVKEALSAMEFAKKQGVFMMEAMWSYFLPAIKTAKKWLDEGRIGKVYASDCVIGFKAPTHEGNRYFTTELGGGAAYDLTVYTYDLTTFMLGRDYLDCAVSSLWHESGVDTLNHAVLRYPGALASMTSSIIGPLDERLIIYGENGRIVVPSSHFASQAMLYSQDGKLSEHFKDGVTQNGFIYEVAEAVECVRAGRIESEVVPHSVTLDSTKFYEKIFATRNN